MINEYVFRLKENGMPYYNCFCIRPELIENYEAAVADTTQVWECHHKLETHNSDGERRLVDLSKQELIALGMYYNRPAEELIFLTCSEHVKLHKKDKQSNRKGAKLSEETKSKMSASHKGNQNCKGRILSEETKAKIGAANKGKKIKPHSEEHKAKLSAALKAYWLSKKIKSTK